MTNFLNNNSIKTEGSLRSYYCESDKKPARFSWIAKLFDVFAAKEQEQPLVLNGRICQLHENVHLIKEQIESIKQELIDSVNEELLPLVKEVLDPLLREIGNLHKDEEALIQKYDSWIENAQKWVKIYAKKREKGVIFQELAKHVIQRCFDRIDRDLQFINEYIDQYVVNMVLGLEEKAAAKAQIYAGIASHYDNLESLKSAPETESLKAVEQWKASLDMQRAELMHTILHRIENKS